VVELQFRRLRGDVEVATFVHHLETDRTEAWWGLAVEQAGEMIRRWAGEAVADLTATT
jgi:hypothetical protein